MIFGRMSVGFVSPCMHRAMLAVIGVCLISVPCVLADDAVFQSQYDSRYSNDEKQARTPEDREALAQRLLDDAQTADDAALAVFLASKSHQQAARDRENYALAAKALELMQQRDPSLRLEALQGVRDLYKKAFEMNPKSNLGMGMGLAKAGMAVAKQMDFELRNYCQMQAIDVPVAMKLVRERLAELKTAQGIHARVLLQAKRIEQRLELRGSDNAQLVADFVSKYEPLGQQIKAMASDAMDQNRDMTRLWSDARRHKANPTSATARDLALALLADFDSPLSATAYFDQFLPKQEASQLTKAYAAPKTLEPAELIAAARWHVEQVSALDAKPRKAVMLELAAELVENLDGRLEKDAADFELARSLADQIESLAQQADVPTLTVALAPQGSDVTTTVASNDTDTDSSQTPTFVRDDNPSPQGTHTNEGNTGPATDTPAVDDPATTTQPDVMPHNTDDASQTTASQPQTTTSTTPVATTSSSRSKHVCAECGMAYRPAIGDNRGKCDFCLEGGKSIFDFGDDGI